MLFTCGTKNKQGQGSNLVGGGEVQLAEHTSVVGSAANETNRTRPLGILPPSMFTGRVAVYALSVLSAQPYVLPAYLHPSRFCLTQWWRAQ
jgi:hypothetical protein